MKQRQVQHRAVPEDYPIIQPEVVAAAKPARDDLGQQLCLMPGCLANRADQVVQTLLAKRRPAATPTKGAVKSMVAMDPQGTVVTVEVDPTVCAPTLSLSDAPKKEGRPYPCGACPAHTPVVPADFDYSGPFRMTNSLFLSQSSDAHHSVGYMWGKGSLFLETTFARTERIKNA
jgi:hypothetical protein